MLRDILSNRSIEKQSTGKMILVLNKADIIDGAHNGFAIDSSISDSINGTLYISCSTGSGIDQLEEQMNQIISSILNSDGGSGSEAESTIITRDRHRRHVRQCVYHLDSFLSKGLPMDAAAEELR